jgi:hypothetical protein
MLSVRRRALHGYFELRAVCGGEVDARELSPAVCRVKVDLGACGVSNGPIISSTPPQSSNDI